MLSRYKAVLFLSLWGMVAQASLPYPSLVSLLEKNPKTGQPVQNLEELLPQLPRDLRANFTFIYQSRSPHGGLGVPENNAVSPGFPRVVLFGPDAKLILAFTGNPSKPGYNVLEAIHWDPEKAAFQFSKFSLPDSGLPTGDNGRINPPECLRCHGQDPRPITDSYPLWPGFYGSVRDTFPQGSPELPLYRSFLRTQRKAKSGVYRLLEWPKGTSVPPYLDPARYNPNQIEASLSEMKFLPNTRLGMALTELNRQRLERKLKASPFYHRYRFGLLAGFLGCRTLPIGERAIEATYGDLVTENADRLRRLGTIPQGPGAQELDMMEIGFYANVIQLIYLGQALGVSRRDWSMAFEDNSLSFFDGILSSVYDGKDFYLKEDFILEMLRDLAKEDPRFQPYFRTYRAYPQFGYPFGERLDFGTALGACGLLLQQAKQTGSALPEIQPEGPRPPRGEIQASALLKELRIKDAPFGSCVKCHEGVSALFIGRKIPFTDPASLKLRLGEKSASSDRLLLDEILHRVKPEAIGHMPPIGHSLNDEEQENLRRYLQATLALN